MLNLSEIASSTEERVLSGVKVSQTFVLDGLKNTVSFADRVIPANVSERIEEQVANMPSATPVVEGAFDFAAKMLDAQRDFVAEVIEILQPAPVKKVATKKVATKKAATKKAPARKPAAKKAA